MRRRIIEAITHPRMLLLHSLDLEDCEQHGYYNPVFPSCRNCEQREVCCWLNRNDEFSVLAARPLDQLFLSLQYCIDYVTARCSYEDHNVSRCACESCMWVRDAQRLAWEYRGLMGCNSGVSCEKPGEHTGKTVSL